jgi:hypothetical protein
MSLSKEIFLLIHSGAMLSREVTLQVVLSRRRVRAVGARVILYAWVAARMGVEAQVGVE